MMNGCEIKKCSYYKNDGCSYPGDVCIFNQVHNSGSNGFTMGHTMRKIIQIAFSGVENTSQTQCNAQLFALCDDGTLWMIKNNDDKWIKIPNVPQEESL